MEGDALMRNFFTTFRLVVGLILALFGHVLMAQEDPAVESLPKKEREQTLMEPSARTVILPPFREEIVVENMPRFPPKFTAMSAPRSKY